MEYGIWNAPTTPKIDLCRCLRDLCTIEIRAQDLEYGIWHVLKTYVVGLIDAENIE